MSDALAGLLAARVKVHRIQGKLVSAWVREPSGTDWVSIKQIDAAIKASGGDKANVPGYAIVPLLLCDENGEQAFPDYEKGMAYIRTLRSDALAELVDLMFEATGLKTLSIETAEKKSSASPTSDSLSDSP